MTSLPHSTAFDDTTDWVALAKYIAGESSADERVAVDAWLDAVPARRVEIVRLEQHIGRLGRTSSRPVDIEAGLARVRARRNEPVVVDMASRRSFFRRPALRAAAAFAIAAVGGITWWATSRTTPTAAPLTYATVAGQMDTVSLADGSRVLLGPSSSMRIEQGGRRVALAGEAFFEVKHDARRPFEVHAGDAIVRDVGTAFVVRATGDTVHVAVTEGAVQLVALRSSRTLDVVAGQHARVAAGSDVSSAQNPDRDDDLAFTRGQLVFRDADFRRVQDELARWYGVTIQAGDRAITQRHLTATFAGDSIRRVIDVIALAMGGTADIRGDTVILRDSGARIRSR